MYLIPIKIRAPLIFAHLACAKFKGASSRSTKVRKLKEEEKMPRMNENTANLQQNKGARKLKEREIWGCAKIRGAKIKGAKFKGTRILMGIRYIIEVIYWYIVRGDSKSISLQGRRDQLWSNILFLLKLKNIWKSALSFLFEFYSFWAVLYHLI